MEVLKEKNGVKTAVTMENGKIIRNMDLLYKSMEMEINLKEDGCKICVMEKVFFFLFNYLYFLKTWIKEPCGWILEKVNYGNNTLEIGQKIKKLVEEQNFFKMEIVMMELGKKTCLMEKEEWYMLRVMFTRECGLKAKIRIWYFNKT